jgi:hypothetical protein
MTLAFLADVLIRYSNCLLESDWCCGFLEGAVPKRFRKKCVE